MKKFITKISSNTLELEYNFKISFKEKPQISTSYTATFE